MRLVLGTRVEKQQIIEYARYQKHPIHATDADRQNFLKRCRRFSFIHEELLYRTLDGELRVVIADDEEARILSVVNEFHLPGHRGVKATWQAISGRYIGFSRSHVEAFVRGCEACQRFLPLKVTDPLRQIVAIVPWERVQVDLVDLRKYADGNGGFAWILNVVDCCSKFLFSFPLVCKSGKGVVECLERLFQAEGAPRILQSDNGKEFVNAYMVGLLNKYMVEHKRGRPRHPQSQGQVERVNQTITRKLAKQLHGTDSKRWVDILAEITHGYNLTWHRATNCTPMLAFRGRSGTNIILGNGNVHSESEPEPDRDSEPRVIAIINHRVITRRRKTFKRQRAIHFAGSTQNILVVTGRGSSGALRCTSLGAHSYLANE